jgi:benzoate/toluate 1,2-dioxygenase subunit beta
MDTKRRDVESFIYLEARLMDEHRYEAWLSLWSDDALYWVPCNDNDIDPTRHVSLIYDDRLRIEDRVRRLEGNAAHAQKPNSRLTRVISNMEIEDAAEGEVTVHSNFNLTEVRRGRLNVFAGRTTHRLRPSGDCNFKIIYKKVMLVNNDAPIGHLTFLI